ncbi:MAG: hypothetical protein R3F17_06860 [Planctomycetota bacterium]
MGPGTVQVLAGTAPGQCLSFERAGHPVLAYGRPVAGSPGVRLRIARAGLAAVWQDLRTGGCRPAGLVVFDSLRAESVTAQWGVDLDDSVYPQEARLDDAFSLSKGCYIGQEVVAKIDTYGGLNKRLHLLRVGDEDPVAPGTRLFGAPETPGGEARDLGVVTTWAWSFALDGGVVLAYVKRKHQETGHRVRSARATGPPRSWNFRAPGGSYCAIGAEPFRRILEGLELISTSRSSGPTGTMPSIFTEPWWPRAARR